MALLAGFLVTRLVAGTFDISIAAIAGQAGIKQITLAVAGARPRFQVTERMTSTSRGLAITLAIAITATGVSVALAITGT